MRLSRTDIVFLLFAVLQLCFWYHTVSLQPELEVVPEVPSETTVKAISFGDEQFYFRTQALAIQFSGDTFGRSTALKDYDYNKLSQWFFLLDTLDNMSNFVPAIASYYYSQTQRKEDVRYIVDYLEAHASNSPEKKWWWMAQAVYLANHRMNDKPRALELALKLSKLEGKNIPIWAKQMPAFIYEQMGEKEEALLIIKQLIEHEKQLPKEEKNFMRYFIHERLNTIIKDGKGHPQAIK